MAMFHVRWQRLMIGVCVLISAGCVPGKRLTGGGDAAPPSPPPARPAAETAPPPPAVAAAKEQTAGHLIPVDDPQVAARALFYEKTLNDWREAVRTLVVKGEGKKDGADSWRDCLLAAEQALAGYHVLQAGPEKALNPWQVVARDVGYYEKGCDQVLAGVQGAGSPDEGAPSPSPDSDELYGRLRQAHDGGNHQAVISQYEAVAGAQGQGKASRESRALYGKALVKAGRFDDAARVYTELLAESSQGADLATLELRLAIGDVLLAAGRLDDARQVYEGQVKTLTPLQSKKEWAEAHARVLAEQIPADELARYRQLMQAYLRFDGKQIPPVLAEGVAALEGRPPGPVLDLAKMMLATVRTQAQAWARGQLAEVRSLISTRQFDQARVLLEQVTASSPPELMGAISQLKAEVAQGQESGQTPSGPGAAVPPGGGADPWQAAMLLFEQQKYDEAIAGFQQFVGSERAPEAQAKIAEAVELAAQGLRRQAAALFAQAKNTFDPEVKRQTLQGSRALLVQLVEKYPQASIVAKANQNLKAIDAELGGALARPSPQQ